jgi:hypothetical protein
VTPVYFSPSTSVSPANSHSADSSTLTIIHYQELVPTGPLVEVPSGLFQHKSLPKLRGRGSANVNRPVLFMVTWLESGMDVEGEVVAWFVQASIEMKALEYEP